MISVILGTLLLAKSSNIKVANIAEQVIQKYKDDPFERVRILYGMELRAFQWEWWFLLDQYPDTLGYCCNRVGKTVVIQLKNLDEKLINSYEEEMIFAPKHDQAVESFKVQYNIIEKENTPINAYIKKNAAGKPLFGMGFVQFENKSSAKTFGVTSNFEGENATIQHIDELDDIPPDTLKRIMGRSIGKNRNGMPTRHRLTGVIWGKLNIWKYLKEYMDGVPDAYFRLPPVNVYMALAAGWLDIKAVRRLRQETTDDEWLRTQCLKFIETRNFIWSVRLRLSQYIGLKWGLSPIPPAPAQHFYKNPCDRVSFGLDMGAQGSGDDASDYSLQVTMSNGPHRRWVWGKTWPGTEDPEVIISDVCTYWAFFKPDGGFGDRLQANLIAQINDRLYQSGLISVNWRKWGGNEQEHWRKWAKKGLLTPINNDGWTKHNFYISLESAIRSCMQIVKLNIPRANLLVFPQVDRYKAKHLEHWKELQILIRELENLQAEKMASGYYKISRIVKKIEDKELQYNDTSKLGDDRADALAMSNYFLDYMERKNMSRNYEVAYIPGI